MAKQLVQAVGLCAVRKFGFLNQWIWPYIEPHIDTDQLGGLPGCSVNHYLIQMLDFIHKKLDNGQKEPTAVLCGLVDFSNAFNRIDHIHSI